MNICPGCLVNALRMLVLKVQPLSQSESAMAFSATEFLCVCCKLHLAVNAPSVHLQSHTGCQVLLASKQACHVTA
jgi:hypothetical protein